MRIDIRRSSRGLIENSWIILALISLALLTIGVFLGQHLSSWEFTRRLCLACAGL